MEIDIPGYGRLQLEHVVMDYNGTLAIDGRLIDGVKDALNRLANHMNLHVITADTFGLAAEGLRGVNCRLRILTGNNHTREKREFVGSLGEEKTVSIGNGRNDREMLHASALGIAVILGEGAAVETVVSADIVCPSILSAIGLLENPMRLKATLRS
ncbi:MAG: ATPase P [Desulfosalsimonadaceae bacterium]